jgi:hypothetical protein
MIVTRYVLDDVKTKQLQWYGHVQRMEEGRLPKRVLEWRPSGRRKRGRPNDHQHELQDHFGEIMFFCYATLIRLQVQLLAVFFQQLSTTSW